MAAYSLISAALLVGVRGQHHPFARVRNLMSSSLFIFIRFVIAEVEG